jgi:glycosyltransferase involved in cell wall biosynthesis
VKNRWLKSPAVIIVGPPWVRSGTARVIQNQIEYYRQRGYLTVFLGVAVDPLHVRTCWVWDVFQQGVHELGAECVSSAPLERFMRSKYYARMFTSLVRHRFRGTVLNSIVDIARTAQLPDDFVRFLRELPVALIHVNHVYTLGFAQRLRSQWIRDGHRVPMILETHDVQSQVLHERGDLNPWTRRPDTLERLVQSEKALLKKADVLVHCSVDDIKFFQTQMPYKPHVLTLPVIDEAFISAANGTSPPLAKTIDLLFVGAGHVANLAAVKWFFEQVWPQIADRRYSLNIVGAVDKLVSRDLPQIYESFRSCFVGSADDLIPYYLAARCVVAPMVSGCGISIKTIEALALGKPFIGTSKAFRGMPMERVESVGLRPHDAPEAFAEAIVSALATEQMAGALSRAAYDRVFSLQAAFASRDEAVRIATCGHP